MLVFSLCALDCEVSLSAQSLHPYYYISVLKCSQEMKHDLCPDERFSSILVSLPVHTNTPEYVDHCEHSLGT